MISISGFALVKDIPTRAAGQLWPWRRLVCVRCGGKVIKKTFNVARHLAREVLEQGWLGGADEQCFQSTRDDLGWKLHGRACPTCKEFMPEMLSHNR